MQEKDNKEKSNRSNVINSVKNTNNYKRSSLNNELDYNKKNNSLINIVNKNLGLLHIILVILGAIFIILPCFHTNLWFDESYTISISRKPFLEILNLIAHDVHPVLYYYIIKVVSLLTNGSIIGMRICSAIPVIIMSILGYTHIKKDFGEKIGVLFSFFSIFWPTSVVYASELRMYTWEMLFVTLTAIYAYRILKYREVKNKNWILFACFSLASAYTHYYGLIASFIINLLLLIYFSIKSYKNKEVKNNRYLKNLKRWFISAVIQIIAYIPWFYALIKQIKHVAEGFWIGAPNIPKIVEFQFTGNLDETIHVYRPIALLFTILFFIYLIYSFKKNWNRDEIKPAKLALLIYILVILVVLAFSIIRSIFYARYLLTITGLFIFIICILLSREKGRTVFLISTITLTISLIANINLINENYDKSNIAPYNYVIENKMEDDIYIVSNDLNGFHIITGLNINPENVYFLNVMNWHDIEEAYKTFGITIKDLSVLEDYKGRIWAISNNDNLGNEIINNLENSELIKSQHFETNYRKFNYEIALIEKN